MPDPAREHAGLADQAAALEVELSPRQVDALLTYRDLLLRWNRAFNLVSRRDTARLIPRHLLDSLSVTPWLVGRDVLDLGTGAGLPGVPLAIAREDAHFTLIDLSERRIRFLGQVVRALGLRNVSPRRVDVRELPAEAFDTVVTRAVSDPDRAWTLARVPLRHGGRMVIMSRAGGPAEPADPGSPVPAGARLEGRRLVRIPGLDQPHELMLLRHADRVPAGSPP